MEKNLMRRIIYLSVATAAIAVMIVRKSVESFIAAS